MRVFVTGATGFIGSAVVRELLGNGHRVTGLARSDKAAAAVAAAGAEVCRGSLQDTAGLEAAAAAADGVIHTGYIHDFSPTGNPAAAAAIDGAAIAAFGEALAGTAKPLVVASGLPAAEPGQVVTEDLAASDNPHWPRVSERAAMPFADRNVRVSVLRLPPSVHGEGDYAFVPALIGIARAKGLSAYVGEGRNVWPAVHRLDAARLFRIAVEQVPAGTLLNAIGDEGVPFRDIAETIGRHLDVPVKSLTAEESREHFGTFAVFAGFDVPASSARTRQRFGWRPAEPGLIADLDQGHYFTVPDN
ncbi:SDR family oxidoreductase [Trebonia kvetii]|uniref:SDR family oxidoreductase n=1 Tax=Trebonia kvetii TaxID=2480626 RepID=A0A6P2BPQ9_9ACTN|nr:SDR family oxidoreductase [Trebonia kvetii]TVZ00838.1 SDR family oxidoreductase [Trebonia kvetii]